MSKIGDIFSSLYGGYKKLSFYRNRFFSYRYFIRDYDKIEEIYVNAKRKVIHNGKECYFPKEISSDYTIHQGSESLYLWDGNKRHPVTQLPTPYNQSYNGNTIYAIPLAGMAISSKQKKIFGFNKEELENKTVVIEVDNNGNIVLSEPGEALCYSFSGGIKPTSFRVADRKTGKIRWIPSLIMLPFNLGGAACSFVCGIGGGILNKIGGAFLFLSNKIPIFPFSKIPVSERISFWKKMIPFKLGWIYIPISKGLDDEISADKNGALKSNQRLLKTRSAIAFVFESLASLFIATGSVVEGTGCTADALLRTPNLIFHHDDLDRKATWANIKSSITNTYHDLFSIGKHATSSFQACKARMNGDIEKLQKIKGISDNKDTGDEVNKQKHNSPDNIDQEKIKKVSKGLNGVEQSTIAVGTKKGLDNSHQQKIAAGRSESQTARSCQF